MGPGHVVNNRGSDVGIFCHPGFVHGAQTAIYALPGHECHSEAKSRAQVSFYLLFQFILVCLSLCLSEWWWG